MSSVKLTEAGRGGASLPTLPCDLDKCPSFQASLAWALLLGLPEKQGQERSPHCLGKPWLVPEATPRLHCEKP